MHQFAWMADYVEKDHSLETIYHNFSAEQHGKGTMMQRVMQLKLLEYLLQHMVMSSIQLPIYTTI